MKEASVTFCVQAFNLSGRKIEAEPPRPANDEGHALRLGERLARLKDGVVVLRQDGDPSIDGHEEPVVLAIHGRVPLIFQDLPF